jgi:D-sedoheptulose 7-phosphate isomerase
MRADIRFEYLYKLQEELRNIDSDEWIRACEILYTAYKLNKKVWIGGNGGNTANAFHFATDWNKGLFQATGKALSTRTFWDNPALMSAYSNDQAFDSIYVDQLRMWAGYEDVVVLLSAGGKSKNVIEAARYARKAGLTVIGLTGGDGTNLKGSFDCHIHIPTNNIQIVEDVHAAFGHTVMTFILDQCSN